MRFKPFRRLGSAPAVLARGCVCVGHRFTPSNPPVAQRGPTRRNPGRATGNGLSATHHGAQPAFTPASGVLGAVFFSAATFPRSLAAVWPAVRCQKKAVAGHCPFPLYLFMGYKCHKRNPTERRNESEVANLGPGHPVVAVGGRGGAPRRPKDGRRNGSATPQSGRKKKDDTKTQ